MSKQSTLFQYGFKSSKATQITIKVDPVSKTAKTAKSQQLMTIVKTVFICNGKKMNVNDTYERHIVIDGSANEYFQKVKRIISWRVSHPKFNISAIEGILKNAEIKNQFSNIQRHAIDNVYYKFKVFDHPIFR